MKKTTIRRILLFLICLISVGSLSLTAFAEEVESSTAPAANSSAQDYMGAMNQKIFTWYNLLRNYIAVPFLIVSFASCGFKFLGVSFLSKGEFSFDKVTQQFITSILALAVLVFLPLIIGWAKGILSGSAWSPPSVSFFPFSEVSLW